MWYSANTSWAPSADDQVKAHARDIINLNVLNMKPIDGRAKSMADNATRLMVLLAVAGAGLAVLFTLVVSRIILRPLPMRQAAAAVGH